MYKKLNTYSLFEGCTCTGAFFFCFGVYAIDIAISKLIMQNRYIAYKKMNIFNNYAKRSIYLYI